MRVLDTDTVDRLVEAVREVDLEFLPRLRWVLLGKLAESKLFPEGFCARPTPTDLQRLLAQLQVQGYDYQRQILQAKFRPDRAMDNLAFLETLHPNTWKHPAEVIKRPWELERMLMLCEERIVTTRDAKHRKRLESILPKLKKAQAIEASAAERRNLEAAKRPKRRPKPKKVS